MRLNLPSFDDLIQYQVECLSSEGRSQKTIKWYCANLRRFLRFLRDHRLADSIDEIGVAEARRFVLYLQTEVTRWQDSPYTRDSKRLSPFSVLGYVRTIKAFWSWLIFEGYITSNPMEKLKLPRVPKKVIITFTPEHIVRMVGALDRTSHRGFRDYCIVLLLLDTGMRKSELLGLRVEDIDFKQSSLRVRGKGNKERIVPLGTQARRTLWRYLSVHRPETTAETTNLFLATSGERLGDWSVRWILARLAKKAGISGVRCSAHTFRHTFAKEYLMQGGDVFSLQKILGHSSLEMVRTYVNLAQSDVALQHRKFSPVDNLILPKNRPSPGVPGMTSTTSWRNSSKWPILT